MPRRFPGSTREVSISFLGGIADIHGLHQGTLLILLRIGKINPSTFPALKPGDCSGLILSGPFDSVLVEFSHSLCPDCAKKLYPEFDIHG
jgi:hypothetical protein